MMTTTPRRALAASVSLLLLAASCAGDGGSDVAPGDVQPQPDAGGTAAVDQGSGDGVEDTTLEGMMRGPCAAVDLTGFFEVVYGKNFSYFSGEVSAFPAPMAEPEVLLATGSCTVFRQVNLLCATACGGGQLCGTESLCVDAPGSEGVGTVTVSGLLTEVSLDPDEGTGFYIDNSLEHPPFAPGSPIRLDATGGNDAAFTLFGIGVDRLETEDTEWVLSAGAPVSITWLPGSVPEADVEVTISIDTLGQAPAEIRCRTEDTGTLEIAADLVDELLLAGTSGMPAGVMTRLTVDGDMIDRGCVELQVYSSLAVAVTLQ
jgi:hypothetical protein